MVFPLCGHLLLRGTLLLMWYTLWSSRLLGFPVVSQSLWREWGSPAFPQTTRWNPISSDVTLPKIPLHFYQLAKAQLSLLWPSVLNKYGIIRSEASRQFMSNNLEPHLNQATVSSVSDMTFSLCLGRGDHFLTVDQRWGNLLPRKFHNKFAPLLFLSYLLVDRHLADRCSIAKPKLWQRQLTTRHPETHGSVNVRSRRHYLSLSSLCR